MDEGSINREITEIMRRIAQQPDISLDAGIDLYMYRAFLHYDRKEIGDVRVDMGDGKPWIPVQDWMKEGKKMTPDQIRHMARYFYERGRESTFNTKTTEKQ